MKILVLLFASLFGFGLVSQDVASISEPKVNDQVAYVSVEQPVATIALDTIEVVYIAPSVIAKR